MKNNIVETIIGAVVIFSACFFAFYLYNSNKKQDDEEGYTIGAKFQNVSGIIEGSDVQIAGIVVGSVTGLTLDKDTYSAIVKMNISPDIKIPKDSSVAVISNGMLGGKYLAVTPGADDAMLAEGDSIKFTQSTISIEALINKFVLSSGQKSQ
jgi:phospholipid/cholesterol/gamma-HCH transport system substrate-binding protein